MKIISVWQPWASLLIHRHKLFETRGWPAPPSVVGQTIGIAATKNIKPEQIAAYEDPDFQQFYSETGLPELMDLPRGSILGTVQLHSCEVMTEEFMEDVTEEEKMFGWWIPGRYAWRVREPKPFKYPVIARGAQGLWSWNEHGALPVDQDQDQSNASQGRPQSLRRHLSAV